MSNYDGFKIIYEQYSKSIYIYCYKMTSRIHIAQEIMQDTFVRFFEKCSGMDLQNCELSAYLYKIAHNLCVDHIRKECRFASLKAFIYDSDISPGIEEHVTGDCYSEAMQRWLKALTPTQRSIVILHAVEKLSHSQIASILNKREEAVRKQYQRSKDKIRDLLEREGVMKNEASRPVW